MSDVKREGECQEPAFRPSPEAEYRIVLRHLIDAEEALTLAMIANISDHHLAQRLAKAYAEVFLARMDVQRRAM